ncbi:hypothetical protein ACVBEQ_07640 [Nakamurella sp. GG22]
MTGRAIEGPSLQVQPWPWRRWWPFRFIRPCPHNQIGEVMMTLTEIEDRFEQISERWHSDTRFEKQRDLADLDDLLAELDDLAAASGAVARTVDELRGRIEILMDDVDACLGGVAVVIDRSAGISSRRRADSGGATARS